MTYRVPDPLPSSPRAPKTVTYSPLTSHRRRRPITLKAIVAPLGLFSSVDSSLGRWNHLEGHLGVNHHVKLPTSANTVSMLKCVTYRRTQWTCSSSSIGLMDMECSGPDLLGCVQIPSVHVLVSMFWFAEEQRTSQATLTGET